MKRAFIRIVKMLKYLYFCLFVSELVSSQNLTEAKIEEKFITPCQTPNNRNGYCIEIQKCRIFMKAIEDRDESTFPFIKASKCGPDNEDPTKPKVCCGEDINFLNADRRCTTPNGEQARCVPINDCKLFLSVLSSADETSRAFLKASVCPSSSGVVVCCGSHTTYQNQLVQEPLLPDRDTCGYQDDTDKVFGGTNAGIVEYPWLAALQYKNQTGHLAFKCGGALISKRYVLTAAHCVTNPSLTLHRVRLGEWDLDSPDDCLGVGHTRQCINKPKDLEVEEIITHDKYYKTLSGVFYDIALLRLKTPVSYSISIRPICLPKPNERSPVGELVYVAGWGNTEYANYSPIKQKLGVPIMDKTQCEDLFRRSGVTVDDNHICAGGETLKDTCKGDSGGPLMARVTDNPSQFYLEGVVSYGAKRCGTQGVPGIYTRVNKYLDWIKSHISP